MQREPQQHGDDEPPQGLQQVKTEARSVIEQQARDRKRRKLHDHFDDLGRNFIEPLHETQERRSYLYGQKRDGNTNHQPEEHQVKHVRIGGLTCLAWI